MWLGIHSICRFAKVVHSGSCQRQEQTDDWEWWSGDYSFRASVEGSDRRFVAQFCKVSRVSADVGPYWLLSQLRFEEGDWSCWFEKPRRNLLHELSLAVAVLYQLLPKSKSVIAATHRPYLKYLIRLSTKYPPKTTFHPKVWLWLFNVYFIIFRRPTNL